MSELPPTIDAILESIRARVTGEVDTPPLPPPAPPEATPLPVLPFPAADPGSIRMDTAGMTLDQLMQAMLEPMLKAWLDARLPEIVEKVAQAEIRRIAGQ